MGYSLLARLNVVMLLCMLLASQASGINDEQKPERLQKEPGSFSCILWEKAPGVELELYFQDGGDFIPLKLNMHSRSKVRSLKVSDIFSLYMADGKDEEGKAKYREVGRAPQTPRMSHVLYVLFPEEHEGALHFRILPLNDALKHFPAGSFCFVNFTEETLDIRLSLNSKKIPSQETAVMASNVDPKGNMVPCVMKNEQDQVIFGSRLFAQASGREIVFISPSKKQELRPSIKFLPQLLPQKLPKKLP